MYRVEPKMDKDTGEIVNKEQWLCSAINVIGKGEDEKERYLILEWSKGKKKQLHERQSVPPTLASVKDGAF
ncbi:hypothetical protein SODG_006602 [Sodalis praecaptivus]